MKLQLKTTEVKPLQVLTCKNRNDIAKTKHHSRRVYARGNRVDWCDIRLNGRYLHGHRQ